MKWLFLKKNYEANLDVNTENWQTDQHYLAIKERLINVLCRSINIDVTGKTIARLLQILFNQ